MSSSMRMLTDVPVLLILATTAIQQNVVRAQSQNDPYYTVYHWFSPGRIVGIAVGLVVLLLLILTLLIRACRRRKRAKAASNVALPTYPAEGVQQRPYPAWQQPPLPYYGPYADPRLYHSAPGTAPAPYGQPKNATPPRDARGTAPPEHTPRTVPLSDDGQRRPAPTSQAQRPAPPGLVQRPAHSGQVQRPASTSQVQSTVLPGQAQSIAPQGQVQSGAPPGLAQTVAPSEGAPSLSSARAQEQVPPPRSAYTKVTQSAGVTDSREPSPPPYSPPTRPLEPSAAHAAR